MKYIPTTKKELINLLNNNDVLLKDIDTSLIKDMSFLFYYVDRQDLSRIESWNVSKVESMEGMFAGSQANPDVSRWNVGNVKDMSFMFHRATNANPDVSRWDVGKVTYMSCMFSGAIKANPDVSNWNISNVKNKSFMFSDSEKEL